MDFVATTTSAVTYGDWIFVNSVAIFVLVLSVTGFLMSLWSDR